MKLSIKKGFSFGLTSGIITTLGLIVGLHSGTHSKLVIIGGILVIAIADAFSDALGIHISEESSRKKKIEIWESTIATFLSKFIFALTFIVPIVLFSLDIAILASILWGFCLLGIFSYYIAKSRRAKPWKAVLEHLLIAMIVIIITHYVGEYINFIFN